MSFDDLSIKLVIILTVGFGLSSILGYLTFKMKLSPILGYLLAGYIVGPYSPGIVVDVKMSEQLAEIGVILMMFGVGLHFQWQDLVNVRRIAVPGAIIQMVIATAVSTWLIHLIGWSIESGLIIGLAIGVASTIVMLRVFLDNDLVETLQGHISIGWLIVEDILTVIVLILLPVIGSFFADGDYSIAVIGEKLFFILMKIIVLFGLMFTLGQKLVTMLLHFISDTKSQELFTLTILALTFLIATGSAIIFGTSFALGAFLAGMVIGRTDVRNQASENSLPMRDAFVVLFFLSVGMLFNPTAIMNNWSLFLSVLGVILIVKPLATFIIVKVLRYPFIVALTVALAMAQIGEFSFILAEEALALKILPDDGFDIIVACALFSIALNPLLFRLLSYYHGDEQTGGKKTQIE